MTDTQDTIQLWQDNGGQCFLRVGDRIAFMGDSYDLNDYPRDAQAIIDGEWDLDEYADDGNANAIESWSDFKERKIDAVWDWPGDQAHLIGRGTELLDDPVLHIDA